MEECDRKITEAYRNKDDISIKQSSLKNVLVVSHFSASTLCHLAHTITLLNNVSSLTSTETKAENDIRSGKNKLAQQMKQEIDKQ